MAKVASKTSWRKAEKCFTRRERAVILETMLSFQPLTSQYLRDLCALFGCTTATASRVANLKHFLYNRNNFWRMRDHLIENEIYGESCSQFYHNFQFNNNNERKRKTNTQTFAMNNASIEMEMRSQSMNNNHLQNERQLLQKI